ncbi:MAG: DUF4190 domain-containing protein [Tepidisphaeraceae bacterium]|jgi:uncharacterized membrane protein
MTQSKPPQIDQSQPFPAHTDPAADTEPLLHLHKMSTTAGLGSQDYVAINVTAVVAVIFGLASALCALGYLLLIIPIVGTVLGIVALRQIRNSNGTQSGRALAWTGLVLAGGITIGIGGYHVADILHRRADEQALSDLCGQFGQALANHQYEQAYALFDADFQQRYSLDAFKDHLIQTQQQTMAPTIASAAWNGLADFRTDAQGVERANSMIRLHFPDSSSDYDDPRLEIHFTRTSDGWRIDDVPEMFPAPPSSASPQ